MIPSWYCTKSAPILGSFYKEQAEELAARGHDVAVLYATVGSSFSSSDYGITHEVVNGVNTYTYVRPNLTPAFERGRAFQRTLMLKRLYKMLVSEWGKPDVVNLRSSLQGYEAIALCKKYKLPLFFMEHSSFVVTEGPKSAAVKRLKAVMKASKVNACVSSVLMEVMKPFDESTRIIPDFVDERRFYIGEKTENTDTFVFAAMGQLRHIKGHDTLIKAFARLRELTERKVALKIAGTGGLREYLQGVIDENALGDSCQLVGSVPRDDVVKFMNNCDCFVCSSRTEMLSCVLHECAACGVPAIATSCGGPRDIITQESGVLVPVDNVEEMAQAMLRMMDEAQNYDRELIREKIVERFGRDEVCRRLAKACEDAACAEK